MKERLTLHRVAGEQCSRARGTNQPALQDVLLNLKEKVVPETTMRTNPEENLTVSQKV